MLIIYNRFSMQSVWRTFLDLGLNNETQSKSAGMRANLGMIGVSQ